MLNNVHWATFGGVSNLILDLTERYNTYRICDNSYVRAHVYTLVHRFLMAKSNLSIFDGDDGSISNLVRELRMRGQIILA